MQTRATLGHPGQAGHCSACRAELSGLRGFDSLLVILQWVGGEQHAETCKGWPPDYYNRKLCAISVGDRTKGGVSGISWGFLEEGRKEPELIISAIAVCFFAPREFREVPD